MLFVALLLGTSFALRAWSRLLHCGVTGVCNSSGFRIKSLKKYHWIGTMAPGVRNSASIKKDTKIFLLDSLVFDGLHLIECNLLGAYDADLVCT